MRISFAILGMAVVVSAANAQAPTSSIMVFFDWGKDEVRRDDVATLDKLAEEWRSHPDSRLRLSGHTDRSGSASFNRRAGLKRAEMIRDALEERGVPRNAMTLASFGEDRPLVPTEDGVREVQNRRVEIAFEE
jgi:outer membrane protein OmpA-like peptidoglycan-associated protein